MGHDKLDALKIGDPRSRCCVEKCFPQHFLDNAILGHGERLVVSHCSDVTIKELRRILVVLLYRQLDAAGVVAAFPLFCRRFLARPITNIKLHGKVHLNRRIGRPFAWRVLRPGGFGLMLLHPPLFSTFVLMYQNFSGQDAKQAEEDSSYTPPEVQVASSFSEKVF